MCKFSEFNVNETRIIEDCLVKKIDVKQKKNSEDYLVLTLSDGETEITASYWDQARKPFPFKKAQCMGAEIRCTEYGGKKSYTLLRYRKSQKAPEDLMLHAPIDCEETFNYIYGLTQKMRIGGLGEVTALLLRENHKAFVENPAASCVHHSYRGGLIFHTYRMLQSALRTAEVYGLSTSLLVAGIILHDIGKLRELEVDSLSNAEFGFDGKAFGHSVLGIEMVDEAVRKLGIEETEQVRLLKNIIGSHHLLPEHGAVCAPITREALHVHYLDELDAKTEIFEEALAGMEEGTFSQRLTYAYNTSVYKPHAAADAKAEKKIASVRMPSQGEGEAYEKSVQDTAREALAELESELPFK